MSRKPSMVLAEVSEPISWISTSGRWFLSSRLEVWATDFMQASYSPKAEQGEGEFPKWSLFRWLFLFDRWNFSAWVACVKRGELFRSCLFCCSDLIPFSSFSTFAAGLCGHKNKWCAPQLKVSCCTKAGCSVVSKLLHCIFIMIPRIACISAVKRTTAGLSCVVGLYFHRNVANQLMCF